MTDREIIIYLAEKVMGWQVFQSGRGSWWARDKADTLEERDIMLESLHPWDEMPAWSPIENIADAFEVQAALTPAQALASASHLVTVWLQKTDLPAGSLGFFLITATARQRCTAIVEATK